MTGEELLWWPFAKTREMPKIAPIIEEKNHELYYKVMGKSERDTYKEMDKENQIGFMPTQWKQFIL